MAKIGGTLSYNNQTENLVDINDAVARQIVEDFPFLPVTLRRTVSSPTTAIIRWPKEP